MEWQNNRALFRKPGQNGTVELTVTHSVVMGEPQLGLNWVAVADRMTTINGIVFHTACTQACRTEKEARREAQRLGAALYELELLAPTREVISCLTG